MSGLEKAMRKAHGKPCSPEALALWANHITVPEGKGLKLFLRNQADRDISDLRIYYDPAQTKYFTPRVTTIKALSIMEIELTPDDVKALPMDYSLHLKADGYDPVLATRVTSNWFIVRTTSQAQLAKIKFTDPEKRPYYPAVAVLVNKRTAEYWEYEGDPDGMILIPKRHYTAEQVGDYCLFCHYQDPATRRVAVAVLDDYDFGDYEVKAGLVNRLHMKMTVRYADMERPAQIIAGYLPPPLSGAVHVFAKLFGWASDHVWRPILVFQNSAMIKNSGGEIVHTQYDLEKNEIYIHYVVRYGSPIPVWIKILIGFLVAALGLGAIVKVFYEPIVYHHVEIERLRTERAKSYERALADLLELYEAKHITEEMYLKSVEALKHAHETADDATPPHPLWEAFTKWAPVIAVIAIVGLVIYIIYRVVVR